MGVMRKVKNRLKREARQIDRAMMRAACGGDPKRKPRKSILQSWTNISTGDAPSPLRRRKRRRR